MSFSMNDRDCAEFLQWALPRLRMRWPGFRKVRSQVCKRIGRRIQELGLRRPLDYRVFLDDHPSEWSVLDACCRVTISRFFRDRAVFTYLGQEVLPALAGNVREGNGRELRCWSIGAASGEEPYSLALLWDHMSAPDFPDLTFSVTGTEVDGALAERAKEGCYRSSSLKELPAEWVKSGFISSGDRYCLRDELKGQVSFNIEDIRRGMPRGPFHLVLCRNLAFTYFDEALQREVLDRVVERIVPGGALVIGAHETLPKGGTGLVVWSKQHGIYRRTGPT
jgi:chemotaxis protein methyltransferase CheR